jgi:hypothetical protein
MRNTELVESMLALAAARQKTMDAESHSLDLQVERHELHDDIAEALGIDVHSEDWWDATYPNKRKKIFGRIQMLRGREVTPALPDRGFICKCGLRMLYGRRHLHCPAEEKENG